MSHFLYIIYSKSIDKYYVGESATVENRLELHNKHHFKTNFSKAASDWELKLSHSCHYKRDALFLERFIKRMKSRKFILKVIENPSILDDILLKRQ